jgi:hypothetical protein
MAQVLACKTMIRQQGLSKDWSENADQSRPGSDSRENPEMKS